MITGSFDTSQKLPTENKLHLTSNYEVDIWEKVLGLHELPSMTLMKEVINPVGIHSYRPWCISCPSHFQGNLDAIIAGISLPGSLFVIGEWCRLTDGLPGKGEVKDLVTGRTD